VADDARISTALPLHPKTRKLYKRLGAQGCWSLICLFLWVANNRCDGDLRGLSDEDIELAADWPGDEAAFVQTLCEVSFLEGEKSSYRVHDWAAHNPYAASRGVRVDAAKQAAAARWQGQNNADGMRRACGEDAERMREDEKGNAHHPTQPNLSTSSKPEGSGDPDDRVVVTARAVSLDQAIEGVWAYYIDKIGRNPKTYSPTATRKRKGLARLRECLKKTAGDIDAAVGLMTLCVDMLAASDWHMGRDPRTAGKRYCEWEQHLFRSYEQMEKWWNE